MTPHDMRKQIKEQRELLRRAQRWIGVAGGALAVSAAGGKDGPDRGLANRASDALALAAEISKYLERFD